jgi:hypothetical protein
MQTDSGSRPVGLFCTDETRLLSSACLQDRTRATPLIDDGEHPNCRVLGPRVRSGRRC